MLGCARTESMAILRQAEPRCNPIARVKIIVVTDIPDGFIKKLLKIFAFAYSEVRSVFCAGEKRASINVSLVHPFAIACFRFSSHFSFSSRRYRPVRQQ